MQDTREKHGMGCYCEECADTAEDWYCWKMCGPNGWELAEGSRYWTEDDANLCRVAGATLFHYECNGDIKRVS